MAIDLNLILKGHSILIPNKLRAEFLARLHQPHQGVKKTRLRARNCVYWPGINEDIETTVKGCEACQENQKSQPREPMMPHEVPQGPWEVLITDLFHFDGENHLMLTDYFSKFFVKAVVLNG